MSLLQHFLANRRARAHSLPWLGVHGSRTALLGALVQRPASGRPQVELFGPGPVPARPETLSEWRTRLPRHVRANVVLRSDEYRVIPIEPPPLQGAELREAARWLAADALDFPVEDAAIDVLAVPAQQGGVRSQRLVVAAPEQHVRAWAERCLQARLPLAAIDIPELAMRNLSVLAAGAAPHAFMYIGRRSTRLALIWRRELCSFRQLDFSAQQLAALGSGELESTIERLCLEVQRTADSFARQFSGIELDTLLLNSVFDAERLCDLVSLQLPQRVALFDPRQHLDIVGDDAVADATRGRDHLFAIGAALREEEVAVAQPAAEKATTEAA